MSWFSLGILEKCALTSEAGTEREAEAAALGGARHFDARHGARERVKREADAVGLLQPGEIEIRRPARDLAGIEEQRHVDEWPGGPTKFAGHQEPVAVAEAPRRVAAQRMASAKVGHQEVRDLAAGRGRRGRSQRAQRDHPSLAKDGDELL